MGYQARLPGRPILLAARVAGGIIALFVFAMMLDPTVVTSSGLSFALIYGPFLGCYSVGIFLALQYRMTRRSCFWWWCGLASPLTYIAVLAIGLRYCRGVIFERIPLVCGIALGLIGTWLLWGGVLAVLGWWLYARHSPVMTAAPQGVVSELIE